MLKLAGELLAGQLADHEVELDAHIRSPWQVLRTGEYHVFLPYTLVNNSGVLTVDILYTAPAVIPRQLTVDRIAVQVTTAAAAGKKARLGIYRDGTNLYPGSLVLDAGEVAVDSTGVKTITINQTLGKGNYWLVVVSDGAPTLRFSTGVAASPLGLDGTNFYSTQSYWSVAHTYGALPDPFTGGGTMASYADQRTPTIPLRLASLD